MQHLRLHPRSAGGTAVPPPLATAIATPRVLTQNLAPPSQESGVDGTPRR